MGSSTSKPPLRPPLHSNLSNSALTERASISRENDNLLAGMSEDEILREQAELRQQLASRSPGLLNFLMHHHDQPDPTASPGQRSGAGPTLTPEPKHARFASTTPTYISPASFSSSGSSYSPPAPVRFPAFTMMPLNEVHQPPERVDSPASTTPALPIGSPSGFGSRSNTPTFPLLPLLEPTIPALPPSQRPASADRRPSDDFDALADVTPKLPPPPTEDPTELLRQRYFPREPSNREELRWMRDDSTPDAGVGHLAEDAASGAFVCRYDLEGRSVGRGAPRGAGGRDHHAGSSSVFALEDLFGLVRSSVAQQRAAGLRVMAKIVERHVMAPARKGEVSARQEATEAVQDMVVCAGQSVGDKNVGVSTAATGLLHVLFVGVPSTQDGSHAQAKIWVERLFTHGNPLPELRSHFAHSTLDSATLEAATEVLIALVRIGRVPAAEEIVRSKGLLEAVMTSGVAVEWPPSRLPALLPSRLPLELLLWISRASKECCRALVERAVLAPTFRFLALPPWTVGETLAKSERGQIEVFLARILEAMATYAGYGLGTSIRTDLDSVLRPLGSFLSSPDSRPGEWDAHLTASYLRLLRAWTECAVDPHVTDPPHSLPWTQAAGWGAEAADFLSVALQAGPEALAEVTELLALWLEQADLKRFDATEVVERVAGLIPDLRAALVTPLLVAATQGSVDTISANVCVGLLRLAAAHARLREGLCPDVQTLRTTFARVISTTPSVAGLSRLTMMLAIALGDLQSLLQAAITFQTSDGSLGEVLLVEIARVCALPSGGSDVARQALSNAVNLLPLYRTYLQGACSTSGIYLRSPGNIAGATSQWPEDAFVLAAAWPMVALELASGGFLPGLIRRFGINDERAALREVTKAALALLAITRHALAEAGTVPLQPVWRDVLPVFLLEQGNLQAGDGSTDAIFRDPDVAVLLDELFRSSTLEGVSRSSVGSKTPFSTEEDMASLFSTWTDLVGLFDAISFADVNFARVLLPPLSMWYPLDFRMLLFRDYGHVLRNIQVAVADALVVPSEGGLEGFLFPPATDELLLGMFCRALTMREVDPESNEFLYFYACHHLATALWSSTSKVPESTKVGFTKAVLASSDAVCESVLLYRQGTQLATSLTLPPECYAGSGHDVEGRLQWIEGWAEPTLRDRARRILGH